MKNVRISFELLEEGEKPSPGSKFIPHHLVFDVKFDLTRKSRLVAGGHVNKEIKPHTTFSIVVSRDSVRLALILASLNELSVLSADIGNAYLNAPNRERVHTICTPILLGPENTGKIVVITHALYDLNLLATLGVIILLNLLNKNLDMNQLQPIRMSIASP